MKVSELKLGNVYGETEIIKSLKKTPVGKFFVYIREIILVDSSCL